MEPSNARPDERDRTALTLVEIARADVPTTIKAEALIARSHYAPSPSLDRTFALPRYLVMDRYLWTGAPHHQLYGAIVHLAELWGARHVIVDATGVGAGLASFLRQTLGARVTPFVFSVASKSALGWGFLGICASGRFLDYRDDGEPERRQFWREVEAADYTVLDGPNQLMRWGVPDARVHDDLLISAALCAVLERDARAPYAGSEIVEAGDVLG